MNRKTVAIIGGGPAGVSAAIQLKRYGINFFLFEMSEIGGLSINASQIENYPGLIKSVTGKSFSDILVRQLDKFGIKPVFSEVRKVCRNEMENLFYLETESDHYSSEYIIAATGTIPVIPDIVRKAVSEFKGRIFFEVKEIINTTDKKIAILGGGDAAFDYTLSLSEKNQISIINRSKITKVLPLLRKRVEMCSSVEVIESRDLTEIKKSFGDKIRLTLKNGDEINQKDFDFLICAAGRSANSKLFDNFRSPPGNLLFAGDIINGSCRQAVIAAGDGLKCAMKIALRERGKLK